MTVDHTIDRIKAVAAADADVEHMEVLSGEPLLQFTRLTLALGGHRIEFRVTRCRSDHYHYLVDMA